MAFFDFYVAAVPEQNKEAYIASSKVVSGAFKENGAVRIAEHWEDEVPNGETTSFPMAVKRAPGEKVVIGMIEWPSKEVRDGALPKVMQDPRMQPGPDGPLFDGKRMIFGCFERMAEF